MCKRKVLILCEEMSQKMVIKGGIVIVICSRKRTQKLLYLQSEYYGILVVIKCNVRWHLNYYNNLLLCLLYTTFTYYSAAHSCLCMYM
jgi:hypothetical protein